VSAAIARCSAASSSPPGAPLPTALKLNNVQTVSDTLPGYALGLRYTPNVSNPEPSRCAGRCFDGVKWSLDAPLIVINNLAGCVHDELAAAVRNDTFDLATLSGNVRNRLLALGASDWTIRISIKFVASFTITIPGSHLLGNVIDSALQDTGILAILADIASAGAHSASVQKQLDAVWAKKSGDLAQMPGGQSSIDQLRAAAPIVVTVSDPQDGSVYQDHAPLNVSIAGANPSFCTTVMGMPNRIRLSFNGVEYPYDPQQWVWSNNTLLFSGRLVARKTVLVPHLIRPSFQLAPLTLPSGFVLGSMTLRGGQVGYTPKPTSLVARFVAFLASPFQRAGSGAPGKNQPAVVGALQPQIPQSTSVYVAQPQGGYVASLGEAAEGVGWTLPANLGLPTGPTILVKPGLNTLEVVVGTGDGKNHGTSFACSFYVK
jgi:hypothetical protein